MGKLIKLLLLLILIGIVALIAYAYAAPFFGVEFAPDQVKTSQPVTLIAE